MTITTMKKDKATFLVRCLFFAIWTRSTIMPFVAQIFRKIPVFGAFYESFTTVLILLLFFFSANKLLKKMRVSDIVFLFITGIALCGTMLFFQKNAEYIRGELNYICLVTVPMYIFGICYDHELLKRDMFIFSVAGIGVSFGYLLFFLSAREMGYGYDMNAAYSILPSALYVAYWAFEKRKIQYWLISLFAFFYLLIYGTRGPLLAFILYFCIALFFKITKKKSIIKVLLLILVVIMIMVFVSSDFVLSFAENISEFFNEVGFSTRILDKFLEGELSDDSGRAYIQDYVKDAINENPLFGLGIMGDRTVLRGGYTHNLFLEILCSFGIPLGILLILALIIVVCSSLKKASSKTEFDFLLLMVVFVLTKLMFSGSFMTEPYFYFMLGLCVSAMRKYKEEDKQKPCITKF